jgi:plastocyanin
MVLRAPKARVPRLVGPWLALFPSEPSLVALFLFLVHFSSLLSAQPAGSSIRGRVDVRREAAPAETRPSVADLGRHAPRDAPDRRRSVVYLEEAPQAAFETPPPGRARLDQRNETFVPYVLAVTVGSTVDFPNDDPIYHNVFSLSKPKRFDLGRYPRGQSRSVVFDRPGVVRVFCEIHSHMTAFILVFAHRYFAVTDAEGRYRIEGVPLGSYTLAVWNDGAVRARREMRVGSAGDAVEQDFVVE